MDYVSKEAYVLYQHDREQSKHDHLHAKIGELVIKQSPIGKGVKKKIEVKLNQFDMGHFWFELAPSTPNQIMSKKVLSSLMNCIDIADRKSRHPTQNKSSPKKPKKQKPKPKNKKKPRRPKSFL
eukprot:UN34136